jgi:lipoprotein-anchoring transpeptidase ErfK/SrfK
MKTKWMIAAVLGLLAACSKPQTERKVEQVKEKVSEAFDDIAVPWGKSDDPQDRERQRFDERWRQLQSFREAQIAARARQAEQRRLQLRFVTGVKESFKGLNAQAINAAPIAVPISGDIAGPSVLKTQVYLDRARFSVGVLDGRWGRNSAIALWWYQRSRGLDATGAVDEKTFRALAAEAEGVPPIVRHRLTEDDLKGPFRNVPDDVYAQEDLSCLCYESVAEKLAERFHTTIEFLDFLNPDVKFSELPAGASIQGPNIREPVTADRPDIAKVVVSIAGNTFNAHDSAGNLLFHGPTTVGSQYDPSPRETVKVVKIVPDPHFHYQPTLFHDVPDSQPEAHLPPGPNSPVGVVWIALSKAHFGIHGTKDPDSIGYVSSHGCVRLTNWDAKEVAHRLIPGVPVEFLDTRRD